jgi:hypothetical protein
MTDWADTVSELTTGVGTLVLAVATFAAVRSANRSARTAEESMRAGMRPILMHSRLTDPVQKINFGDGKWVAIPGCGAAVEATENVVYLAISVRNAGTGMGILHGWRVGTGRQELGADHTELGLFTPQSRDLYVAPADVGFWQGALRDPATELFAEVSAAVPDRQLLWVELLYGDFEGGQRVISRFNLTYAGGRQFGRADHDGRPRLGRDQGRADAGDGDPGGPDPDGGGTGHESTGHESTGHGGGEHGGGRWLASVVRHWNVDRPNPR